MRIATVLMLALCLIGCQKTANRDAFRAQGLLDDASSLMDARLFKEASENSDKAITLMDPLFRDYPADVRYRLLWCRAHLTKFISENAVTISRAEPRPRSLVRLPAFKDLIGFNEHAIPARDELNRLASLSEPLTFDQRAYIHSSLAVIYRLSLETANEALKEYAAASAIYKEWEQKLRADTGPLQDHRQEMIRISNEAQDLKLAASEVSLLEEKWQDALTQLEEMMAGKDIAFFAVQFKIAEEQIAHWKNQIQQAEANSANSREQQLTEALKRNADLKKGGRDDFASRNPLQMELYQQRVQLAQKQNNLMYRIICYWQLGMKAELEEARTALRTFYPELETEVTTRLKGNQKT